MKIAGFTIIRNAVKNDYPIEEAIRSILPVVDTMFVLIGDCEDETEALIASINDPKIQIHHSVWNKSLRSGGVVLAEETNKAFQLIGPEYTWAFYIQADEVVHECYHSAIKEACSKYEQNQRVQGLLFEYTHFYCTYDYVGDSRRWYKYEVRIIRNNKAIYSYKDAQGFRMPPGKTKIPVKKIPAQIYHYGWVKSPEQMMKKAKESWQYWHSDEEIAAAKVTDTFDFSTYDSLEKFTGTHPQVMHTRIAEKNWKVELDISRKKFKVKDRILYWLEKKTGLRLFDFKNYRII